ncbi:Glutaminyl-tRNA synthetase [Rhodotorula kratochvilovae]
MAPKVSPEVEALAAFFAQCGLSEQRALETARSKTAPQAKQLLQLARLDQDNLDDKQTTLALQVAKDGTKLTDDARLYIVGAIRNNRIQKSDQVSAAIKHLSTATPPFDDAAFDEACGVGFSITPAELDTRVRAYLADKADDVQKAGWTGFSKVSGLMRQADPLRWVAPLDLKAAAETVFEELFGKKEDAKAKAQAAADKAKKEAKTPKASTSAVPLAAESPDDLFAQGWLSRLHKPGGNEQKIPERMKEHLEWTKGKVFTRFPPEPNGFLHIGHSKAIAVNFGYAKYHKGHCYLRYDDTNPEAEEQIYFDKILENVRWLGYEPYQITHSSDHFAELYDLACLLIKKGLAYTSDDTAEEIAAQRGGKDHGPRHESKDRNKPVEQSLSEFADMRAGKYKPGEMVLRMKQDMESPNPTMWDIIAYRVLGKPHHRTGTEWCIYPTYDFTHCLCDSFENISHSLCTTEFIGARTAYEWLCDALEVYKPRQSEYGRLTLEGAITSKRKLLRLVKEGHVSGWDDPRLYTLVALKRRGVPPAAIIAFVSSLGVSTSASLVQLQRFEQTVRSHLEMTTPRLNVVLRPVRVTLENLPADFSLECDKPLHPKDPAMGTVSVPFSRELLIDQDDFRAEASKDFFRLAPGATVGLLNAPRPITYVSHEVDAATGAVSHIVCRYEDEATSALPAGFKPKAWIHWVSAPHAVPIKEARLFRRLFKSDNPGALGDKYLEDLSPDSREVVQGAVVEPAVWRVVRDSLARAREVVAARKADAEKNGTEAPPSVDGLEVVRFQANRVAYFCLDADSVLEDGGEKDGGELVLNLIANLKEDKLKGK